MYIFKPCHKTFPPCKWQWTGAVKGEGGGGRGLEKNDNIFIERKDDILLSCKQISNC